MNFNYCIISRSVVSNVRKVPAELFQTVRSVEVGPVAVNGQYKLSYRTQLVGL